MQSQRQQRSTIISIVTFVGVFGAYMGLEHFGFSGWLEIVLTVGAAVISALVGALIAGFVTK
ncbi:hypothetical protein [Lacticaseibacillus pantheris]|jgi:hypothetical protein|uniref:Uncharacterized protein n=1 Tax=Lacticaseibacillus pantheris DSM 15945 = JCM 12539 = NBRC 106106 TaxID=1423783 RepID=A0A0R1U4C3_9LACO|nr:hypothetical protein [Lacticaseibacillus pantheris]KRL84651.1 hypothetical protein FC50_GL001961 [Lacticaseibacillus pantheris DSM 15945 = JCM 12539 = NBRC 106106]